MGVKCWELFAQSVQGAGRLQSIQGHGQSHPGKTVMQALRGSTQLQVRPAAFSALFCLTWGPAFPPLPSPGEQWFLQLTHRSAWVVYSGPLVLAHEVARATCAKQGNGGVEMRT